MKKLVALVVAILMIAASLSVAFATEATADVAITINGVTTGNTVKIFKLADAAINASNEVEYTMASGLPEAYDTIAEIEGATSVDAMAQAFGATFGGQDGTYSLVAEDNVATGTLAPGYYYAIVTGTADTGVVYKPMLINAVPVPDDEGNGTYVAHDAIEITAKKETVTITKTEPDPTTAAAAAHTTDGYKLGETIPFTITTVMPNYPSNSISAKAIIKDTPDGLDDDESTVTVSVGGTVYEENNNTFEVAAAGKGFTITFAKPFILAHPGEAIIVNYNATLEGPVTLAGGTENTASITYNTNPYEDSEVKPDDTDTQKIYGLVVYKFEEDHHDDKPLKGAKFVLKTAVVDPSDETKTIPGDIVGEEKATGEDGYLSWSGLKNGNYYLVETAAPAGYTKIVDPILVTLNSTTATGDDPTTTDTETYFLTKEVPNTPGQSLPETGGIGTTIFYVAGGLLVLAAVILLVTKRRMSAND